MVNPDSAPASSHASSSLQIGLLPLARTTFDIALAESKLAAMRKALLDCGCKLIGGESLLTDDVAANAARDDLIQRDPDILLVLQTTFTDAQVVGALASKTDLPLLIWAVPEPRDGGRLRLNSFCGLNLASHALGLNQRQFHWLYQDPQDDKLQEQLQKALSQCSDQSICGSTQQAQTASDKSAALSLNDDQRSTASTTARQVLSALRGKRIARIGEHPAGFSTCIYDAAALNAATGIEVVEKELEEWFDAARQVEASEPAAIRQQVAADLDNLDEMDEQQLDNSLRLAASLNNYSKVEKYDAFALRCWPETFTEFGGAACGAAALLGERKVPCACEADVYGAVTQLLLQQVSEKPVFLVDLVDFDTEDNSAVVWHCGQAPLSMCNPEVKPQATIHTNRKMPLLYQFPLRAGEITLLRWSQSEGHSKLVIGRASVLDRPMSYTGTSGVIRFDRPASEVLNTTINSRLEHHVALTYGDYRHELVAVAEELKMPVLAL